MTMPKSPTIEALRAAIERWEWSPGSGGESTQVNAVVEAARALVAEFDEQTAYVEFLTKHRPSAEDVRRLMIETDPATVDRVVSTMREREVPTPAPLPRYDHQHGIAKGTLDP